MLIEVKVGVKRNSKKLKMVGKGDRLPAMFALTIWVREALRLEVPRRMASDFSGFKATPL